MTMCTMTICTMREEADPLAIAPDEMAQLPTADDTDLVIYLVRQAATPGMEQLQW